MEIVEFDFKKTREFVDYLLYITRKFVLIDNWINEFETKAINHETESKRDFDKISLVINELYRNYARTITGYLVINLFDNFYPIDISASINPMLNRSLNQFIRSSIVEDKECEIENVFYKYRHQYIDLSNPTIIKPIHGKFVNIIARRTPIKKKCNYDSLEITITSKISGLMVWDNIIFLTDIHLELFNSVLFAEKECIKYEQLLKALELDSQSLKYYSHDIVNDMIKLVVGKFNKKDKDRTVINKGIYIDKYAIPKYRRYINGNNIWIITGLVGDSELEYIYEDLTREFRFVYDKIVSKAIKCKYSPLVCHNKDQYGDYYKCEYCNERYINNLPIEQQTFFKYETKSDNKRALSLVNKLNTAYKLSIEDKSYELAKKNIALKLVNKYSRSSSFNSLIDEMRYHLNNVLTTGNDKMNAELDISTFIQYNSYGKDNDNENERDCLSGKYNCVKFIEIEYERDLDKDVMPDNTSIQIKLSLYPISIL